MITFTFYRVAWQFTYMYICKCSCARKHPYFTVSRGIRSWLVSFQLSVVSRWYIFSLSPSRISPCLPNYVSSFLRCISREQIYIMRVNAYDRESRTRSSQARENWKTPSDKEKDSRPPARRGSISTCMRNAVAGFSIMWVYKRRAAAWRSIDGHTHSPGWEH